MSKSLLLESIYLRARELGAQASSRALPKGLRDAPSFVAEFHMNFAWSKRQEYTVVEPYDNELSLSTVNLGGVMNRLPGDWNVPGSRGMDIIGFGIGDGGNYVLAFDGNDANPSNPTVYLLDHECDTSPEPISDLLGFLQSLDV